MREIKFRGNVKYNGNHLFSGDWVYGSLIIKSNGVFIYVIEEDEYGNIVREFEVEVIPETVGQFTGLKDRNGKEIFEGDILQRILIYGGREVGRDNVSVIFKDESFQFLWQDKNITRMINLMGGFEVIGNIHDNGTN